MYEPKEFWWQQTKDVHDDVFSAATTLAEEQDYRAKDNLSWLRLFSNVNASGLNSDNYARRSGSRADDVTLNIVHSMCTTVTSKIAKNRPKITFLTSGGDWSLKRKSRLLDKFVNGQFYATDIYTIAPKVFLDATVFGTGVMKIYSNGDRIVAERVFPNEVMTDDAESFYGNPRQMFQRKIVSREVLLAAYPEFEKEILNATRAEYNNSGESVTSNQIECVEAWHLASKKGSPDGRHCICLDNVTLLDEPYDKDSFPFIFIHWTENLLGFWGQGLAEQLLGVQVEINKLLNRIQEQMHLATPKVFIEAGSKISKAHINNEVWGIIEYAGTKPDFHVPRTTTGEVFSHLDRLFGRAYEVAGISQMAAQAKKPAGLDSGVAIREFSDIQSERFMLVAQAYENLFLESARKMIDTARDIEAAGDAYEVISHGDKYIERISWKDINLEEDQYVMQIYPTALLSSTPAAKLQTIQEMAQTGLLNPTEARALLDYPDLEAVNQLATAFIDDVDLLIEEMIEKGHYHPPESFSNLEFAIQRVQSAYLRAKIDKVPEERLELLRRYMDDAIRVLKNQQMEQQAAQAALAPEGAPAGGGGAPAPGAPPMEGGAPPNAIPPEVAEALAGMQ
tara:strand:+ start:1783 stop:3645 length:1863 start_codon:yes stop_codon:yes gene_type:complete